MARTSVQYSKWMITIDGVQVPWIQFSVKTGVDFPGQASIVLEPDQILSRMRPKSLVHIWMYDEYVETAADRDLPADEEIAQVSMGKDIEDRYFLFWEGEVRGTGYSKIPARSYTLTAVGCLGTFDNHKVFMSGVGDITAHPIINGSALFGELSSDTLFNFAVTGGMFDKKKTGGRDPKEDIPFRHSNEVNFADRMLKMIVYFCQYNALLRLHTIRTRILNKIAYIPDKTMGYMIPHILASKFFKDVGEQVSPQDSLLGLLNRYNSYVFYHYVSLTAPHFPEEQPPGFDLISEPGKDPFDSIYSIARSYYRNDYMFIPETFYAIPPSCNLIFPEYIRHISVGRDFLSEPTRAIITDHTLGSKLSVVVPDEILRFQDAVEPADFWTFANTKKNDPDNPPQSPYVVPGTNLNLLGATTDAEIEKGIIPWMVTQPMYLFNAIARDFELDEASRQDIKDRLGSILRLAPLMETGGDSHENQQRAFIYTMKLIADFTLQLNRLRRSVSVSLEGHRWLCPGFPTVILDTDISYIGWVKDHTFTADQEGAESSSVSLDYVRPMPAIDRAKLDEIVRTTGEAERGLENGVKALDDRYDDFQNERLQDGESMKRVFLFVSNEEWEEWNRTGRNDVIKSGWDALENQFRRLDTLYMESIRKPTPQTLQAVSDGALDLSELKAVHDRVEVFFPLTGTEVRNQDEALAVNTLIKRMNRILKDFYDYEQTKIKEIRDIGEQGIPSVATLSDTSLMRSKTGLEALYDKFEAATDPPEDYPYPPVFANQSLMGVTDAEEVYAKVLGAQKIFTKISEDIKEPSLTSATGGLEGFRRKAYAKYAYFLRVLSSIFPVTSPRAPDMDTGGPEDPKQTESNQTEWEKESARDDSLDSVRRWEDRRFLRRTGLMSLGQFIKTNGLKLQRLNSDPPTPMSFIVLAPVRTRQVGDFVWDNTIFSKIVDEFEDVPRIEQPFASDPKIKELRESVKDPFLTTLYRQARMVKYAKKHFGSRGFDGS